MTSRAGTFKFLLDEQVSSLAPVRARPLGQALAGMARVLYELVAGAPAVAGEESASGTNPQGLIGVDLSGPPWGPAIRHPIATMSGLASTANVVQPTSARLNPKNVAGVAFIATLLRWRFWSRPYEYRMGIVSPYSRALIVLRAHKVGVTNASVTVRWRNTEVNDLWSSTTISVTSTSETTFTFSPSDFMPLRAGGGINLVDFNFEVTTSGAEAVIDSISLYQAKKLEH